MVAAMSFCLRARPLAAALWLTSALTYVISFLFLFSLANFFVQDTEDTLAALLSRDITVSLDLNVDICLWVAKVVRCQGYWLAVLVQSRGVQVANCGYRCARAGGGVPFMECVRYAGTQGGACGACIW
jgi:hypothetical protein